MKKHEQLLKIDLSEIKNESLQSAIKSFQQDYEKEKNKALFLEVASDRVERIYAIMETNFPDLLKHEGKEKPASTVEVYESDDYRRSQTTSEKEAVEAFEAGKKVYGLDQLEGTDWLIEQREDLKNYELFAIEEQTNPKGKQQKPATSTQSKAKTETKAKEQPKALSTVDDQDDKQEETQERSTNVKEEALEAFMLDKQVVGMIENSPISSKIKAIEDIAKYDLFIISESKTNKKQTKSQPTSSKNKTLTSKGTTAKKPSPAVGQKFNKADQQMVDCEEFVKRKTTRSTRTNKSSEKKPKPTRLTQLLQKLKAILDLVPDHLKGDEQVQRKMKKLVQEFVKSTLAIWKMNSDSQLERAENAMGKIIEDVFDKVEVKEQKSRATNWKSDFAKTKKKILSEIKENEKEKKRLEALITLIEKAIDQYKTDGVKAFETLKTKLSSKELKEYIPTKMLTELNKKKS